jgi:signal transduction histidine kinase
LDIALLNLLPSKTTLRMRVVLCCAALGGIVGVCLAFVAEQISDHFENVLINEEMAAEMDASIFQHGNDPDARLPRSLWKSLYIDRPGQPPTSPVASRVLSPGVHELGDDKDSDRFAAIRVAPIGRVTMVAGLPNSPERDRRLSEELFAMILLGVVLGAWLGRMLAGSMLAPVLLLSHEVDSAEPGGELQRIAADHRADEVGALANALIRYRARMHAAVEREALFSADASHELRTPLSVLQGALDLLRESAGPSAPGQRRIERIRRSATEMANLLDGLLLIARSGEATDATSASVELGPALASVVAEFREELDAAQIDIGLRCAEAAHIHAPSDLLRVALRLLFRSIASGAYGTRLRLDADAHGIVLASTDAVANASGIDAAALSGRTGEHATDGDGTNTPHLDVHRTDNRRSDEQGGIGMLRRLCQRYGWALQLADDPTQPFLLSMRIWSPEEVHGGSA